MKRHARSTRSSARIWLRALSPTPAVNCAHGMAAVLDMRTDDRWFQWFSLSFNLSVSDYMVRSRPPSRPASLQAFLRASLLAGLQAGLLLCRRLQAGLSCLLPCRLAWVAPLIAVAHPAPCQVPLVSGASLVLWSGDDRPTSLERSNVSISGITLGPPSLSGPSQRGLARMTHWTLNAQRPAHQAPVKLAQSGANSKSSVVGVQAELPGAARAQPAPELAADPAWLGYGPQSANWCSHVRVDAGGRSRGWSTCFGPLHAPRGARLRLHRCLVR